MSSDTTTTRVKFGLSDTARDLDLEVEDAEALVTAFQKAIDSGDAVLWITEEDGHRHGLVVDKIVYIDVEPERTRRGVGFSA